MVIIYISHYTRGKYLGSDDPSVAWSALFNSSPLCAETTEVIAREVARAAYARSSGHVILADWNGDTHTETVLEEKGVTREVRQ